MEAIIGFFKYVAVKLPKIGFVDVLDILIVSFLFYQVYKFVKERRAGKLAVGILFILLAMALSSLFNMNALNYIISNIVQVGIIGLIILFQAELRTFLEKVGGEPLKSISGKKDAAATNNSIEILANAVEQLSSEKTGALIVFERGTKLGDVIKSGTVINADASIYLVKNIFYDKSPLHDGAVVVREGRLHAAGCMLPLTCDTNILKTLGTRHRAAIGMSENSDAVVVVVSEETGTVSLAVEGHLTRGLSKHDLMVKLRMLINGSEENSSDSSVHKRIGKLFILPKREKTDNRSVHAITAKNASSQEQSVDNNDKDETEEKA